MSYIMYQVKCKQCGEIYNTAFGIVGTTLIADPLKKCLKCGGAVKKHADAWASESRKAKIQDKTGRHRERWE